MNDEIMKLIQVAKLYYEENMNQSQIAKKLGVSRPLISNLLTKARNMGIVEIKIKEPFTNNSLLLGQLKNLYNLKGGLVIPTSSSQFISEKSVIDQSVMYMNDLFNNVNCLGVGWGYTMGKLIKKISESDIGGTYDGEVCSLIGGAAFPNKGYHPSELITDLAAKTGYTPKFFFAPAFPTSLQEKDLYMNTDNYKEIDEIWSKLDTVILSIAAYPSVPDHATALRFDDKLNIEGAVGKILSYFYDKDGGIIQGNNDFAMQIPLEKLRRVKDVIAICPTEISSKAIMGALKIGLITHLIISEDLAKEVIKSR